MPTSASGSDRPTNFDLRTQTSNEIEGGARLHFGRFKLQSSVYDMELNDEIFYSPATFTNINLDPTRHWGVETTASVAVSDTVSLHGNVTYTRATFREGSFAGNDIPLISRWTAQRRADLGHLAQVVRLRRHAALRGRAPARQRRRPIPSR